jgi:sulfoxide reductase heme-binding subunit YedZ
VNRGRRHRALATLAAGAAAAAWFGGPPATGTDRVSLATAWLCLVLLGAALLIGPWHALRRGQPLLNHVLRRDLGIWAGLTGLAHLAAATAVVMTPAYFRNYITGPPADPMPGWAGWIGTSAILVGYAIGLLLVRLLAISNDRALRRLGRERWKRAQRLAYVVFGATVLHGLVFQVIERRLGAWLLALLVASATVVGFQLAARRALSAAARTPRSGPSP